jgi:hypothetical protein
MKPKNQPKVDQGNQKHGKTGMQNARPEINSNPIANPIMAKPQSDCVKISSTGLKLLAQPNLTGVNYPRNS